MSVFSATTDSTLIVVYVCTIMFLATYV